MFSDVSATFVAVVGGVICLAMLAVAVSKNAQTSSVLTGAGSALSSVISAAVAPVNSQTNNFGSSGSTPTTP